MSVFHSFSLFCSALSRRHSRGGKRRPWSRRRLTFWSRWDGFQPLKLVPIFALRGIGICGSERRCVSEGEERKIIYSYRWGERMMMVGGSGAAVDHNGIYPNPNLHSLQQPLMEAENADSRKRPLETPEEEAGCTKRTNIGGKTEVQICLCVKQGKGEWQPNTESRERIHPDGSWSWKSTCECLEQVLYQSPGGSLGSTCGGMIWSLPVVKDWCLCGRRSVAAADTIIPMRRPKVEAFASWLQQRKERVEVLGAHSPVQILGRAASLNKHVSGERDPRLSKPWRTFGGNNRQMDMKNTFF